MNERALEKLIRSMMMQGFNEQSMPIRVQRSFQPRNHAAPNIPTLVYHRITTTPVGWQYSKTENKQNPDGSFTGKQTHYSNELIGIQFNALVVNKEPEDELETDVTASDLLRMARMIAVAHQPALRSSGINMLHISTVADTWVQNESDNWELQPSFDIQFAIKQELVKEVNKVQKLDGHIYRV